MKKAKLWFAWCVFLLLFVLPPVAFGQVLEAWNIHYDSPYGGPETWDHDWGKDIAVDTLGNIYVTGWSPGRYWPASDEHDFLTIKYDPQGNELWVARHERGGHDGAIAIALDRDANVYVTGFSEDIPYALDYLTIKYDTDGNELWTARWQGYGVDGPNAITVDEVGNVYVTGRSSSFGTDDDYLTIKYDTNGNELWFARYDGPAAQYSSDEAEDIVVDSEGNVYVTGDIRGAGTGYDYATIKYDADGNELWVAWYDGPDHLGDGAKAIAVDTTGNVYVTGSSKINSTPHYATVKYDADGNELWAASSDFTGEVSALGLDGAGHIYVTGQRYANARDYATIAYDEDGNELWSAFYDGFGYTDKATDLVVDIDGSVVVTGSSKYGDDYWEEDIVTIKYDVNGNELWIMSYDAVGRDDIANAIALDREGNVCVIGWSDMEYSNVFTTIKYVPTVSLGLTCLTPFVKRGEMLQYEATLANNTSESQDFWAWLRAKLPTGEWDEDYLLPPTQLSMTPNQEIIYPVSQNISPSALLGRYEYWGYLGSDTLAVWDCDMFPFSVYYHLHHHQIGD